MVQETAASICALRSRTTHGRLGTDAEHKLCYNTNSQAGTRKETKLEGISGLFIKRLSK